MPRVTRGDLDRSELARSLLQLEADVQGNRGIPPDLRRISRSSRRKSN